MVFYFFSAVSEVHLELPQSSHVRYQGVSLLGEGYVNGRGLCYLKIIRAFYFTLYAKIYRFVCVCVAWREEVLEGALFIETDKSEFDFLYSDEHVLGAEASE